MSSHCLECAAASSVTTKAIVKSPPSYAEARKLLKCLTNTDIIVVGFELGLHFPHLKSMKEKILLDEMVSCWLQEDDNVRVKSGPPSWESLVGALKRAGLDEIAEDVEKDIQVLK